MTVQIPITEADMDEAVVIDAGTLEFNADDLSATGLLVPFGVPARSNLGTFTFSAGDIALPSDLNGMSLNIEHKREDVVGGFSEVWEQPEGVMATFKYRDTPEGRQAFEDGRSGKRKNLSAEVAKVRIRDGKALPGSVLFAAAQVERPAFEGATLLAAEDTTSETHDDTFTDEHGVTWRRVEEVTHTRTEHGSVTESTVTETVTEPPAEAPAEENTETKESTMTASAVVETPVVAGAQVPATLLASDASPAAPATPEEIDLGAVFASIATIKNGIGPTEDAETLLAALTDIKYNATGGLTTAASGVLQPAWVGKLWQGKRYQRKYIDLATHLFGGIQLGGRKGFTIEPGSELVAEWAGNKTELPSGGATTGTKASTLKKYGWAADIAREWFDLEGGADVIEEFLKLVADSYARVTDRRALTDIIAAAAGTDNADLVAPGVYPSVAGHDYPEAMGMLIDAIEAVTDADDEPGFAVVNPTAWRQLLFTPKDLVPEYVTFSVKAGTGEGNADGRVVVKKAPDAYFAGLDTAEPAVAAGAKGAIEFREQGQTPIQLDALDIAKGGVDKAVIGYLETFVVRPESLVLLGTEAA